MSNPTGGSDLFVQIANKLGDRGITIAVLIAAMIICLVSIKTAWIASIAWLIAFVYLLYLVHRILEPPLPRGSASSNDIEE